MAKKSRVTDNTRLHDERTAGTRKSDGGCAHEDWNAACLKLNLRIRSV